VYLRALLHLRRDGRSTGLAEPTEGGVARVGGGVTVGGDVVLARDDLEVGSRGDDVNGEAVAA
jgi:hypothetical protein